MWHFEADNVNDYYAKICKTLMTEGTETSPRGKPTRELHPTSVLIQDPRKRILSCYGRVLNLPFALVEAIHIITGQNDAQALRFYNSGIVDIQGDGPRGTPHWQDNVMRFNAAYGERLRHYSTPVPEPWAPYDVDQLEHVIETLKQDPDSRQASIVLSHPAYDNYTVQTRDRACNVYAHAMIRDGRLDWMQIIRSNDAVWGIPYNMVQWSHVMEWVAASLDVPMGTMYIVQDSFHVYEEKYDECDAVEYFDMYKYTEITPPEMYASEEVVKVLTFSERNIRGGMEYREADLKHLEEYVGPYWRSVIAVLQSYREFHRGYDDKALDLLQPEYAELTVPMLRNFVHWRWHKDKKYADLVDMVYLDLNSHGLSEKEATQWLGTVG